MPGMQASSPQDLARRHLTRRPFASAELVLTPRDSSWSVAGPRGHRVVVLIVQVLVERVIPGPAEHLAHRVLIAVTGGEVLAILPAQLTDGDAHALLKVRVRLRGVPGFVGHRYRSFLCKSRCAALAVPIFLCWSCFADPVVLILLC